MKNIEDVACNLCGLSCIVGPETLVDGRENPGRELNGLIRAKVVGGYESTPGNGCGALDDMSRYTFSLCEFCLDWLFGQFTVPVAVDDVMNDFVPRDGETREECVERMGLARIGGRQDKLAWRPAAVRVRQDAWRSMKSEFFAESLRRMMARDRR